MTPNAARPAPAATGATAPRQLATLKVAEQSEREIMRQLVGDAVNGGRQ